MFHLLYKCFKSITVYLCGWMVMFSVCHNMHDEVSRQYWAIYTLLLSCGFGDWTQVSQLGSMHLHLLRHYFWPWRSFAFTKYYLLMVILFSDSSLILEYLACSAILTCSPHFFPFKKFQSSGVIFHYSCCLSHIPLSHTQNAPRMRVGKVVCIFVLWTYF